MTNYPLPLQTQENILDTISAALNIAPQRLYPGTHLRDNLHLDSVDTTLLIAAIESRLNVYLTPEEVAAIETVDDITRCFSLRAA